MWITVHLQQQRMASELLYESRDHMLNVKDCFIHNNSQRQQSSWHAGLWVGDCFIYNNSAWRLNYCVGGEVTTMFHLDRPMYLLGYLASQSKVYLIDKVSTQRLWVLRVWCLGCVKMGSGLATLRLSKIHSSK